MTNKKQNDLIPDEDNITTTIQNVFKTELSSILKQPEQKKTTLDKEIQKNKTLSQILRENIDSFNKLMKKRTCSAINRVFCGFCI